MRQHADADDGVRRELLHEFARISSCHERDGGETNRWRGRLQSASVSSTTRRGCPTKAVIRLSPFQRNRVVCGAYGKVIPLPLTPDPKRIPGLDKIYSQLLQPGNETKEHVSSNKSKNDVHELNARREDRLLGSYEVLKWPEVGMTCECRNGGVVRNLGCRRLEHSYRPKSLVSVVLVWWWSGLDSVWACSCTCHSVITAHPGSDLHSHHLRQDFDACTPKIVPLVMVSIRMQIQLE